MLNRLPFSSVAAADIASFAPSKFSLLLRISAHLGSISPSPGDFAGLVVDFALLIVDLVDSEALAVLAAAGVAVVGLTDTVERLDFD